MVNTDSKNISREVLTCILRHLPCVQVQKLRAVSRMWDEVCRQCLKRAFENLLDSVSSKKKISEMWCLPACHWYPYTIGCVQYCLLVLQTTIETQFGKDGSMTIPGSVLDRVKEIFSYLNDIPINSELPSDEIYDKLRKFYQVSFSAVRSLEKISDTFYKDVRNSESNLAHACVTNKLETRSVLNSSKCQSPTQTLILGVKDSTDATYSSFPSNTSNTQDDLNQSHSSTVGMQGSSYRIPTVCKTHPNSNETKPFRSLRIRRIKRIPSQRNDCQSTQVNKIDSQASECDSVGFDNNCSCNETHLRKIEQLEKQVHDYNILLKESEERNQEACWKSCTLLSELASCKVELEKLRSIHKQCALVQKPTENQLLLESENNTSSVLCSLRKQVKCYKNKLAEEENQVSREKKENNLLKKRLMKFNRELQLWRSSPRNKCFRFYDGMNNKIESKCREKRLCVLKTEIQDTFKKLQRSECKNKTLIRQFMLLQTKYKQIKKTTSVNSTKNTFYINSDTDTSTPISQCTYDTTKNITVNKENSKNNHKTSNITQYTQTKVLQSDSKNVTRCSHCDSRRRLFRNIDYTQQIVEKPVIASIPMEQGDESPNKSCVFVKKSSMCKLSNEQHNNDSKSQLDDSFSVGKQTTKCIANDIATHNVESEQKEILNKYSWSPENGSSEEGIKKCLSKLSLSNKSSTSQNTEEQNKNNYNRNRSSGGDMLNEKESYSVEPAYIRNEDNKKVFSSARDACLLMSYSTFPLGEHSQKDYNLNDMKDIQCFDEQISVRQGSSEKPLILPLTNKTLCEPLVTKEESENNLDKTWHFDFSKPFEVNSGLNCLNVEPKENGKSIYNDSNKTIISENNVCSTLWKADGESSCLNEQNKRNQVEEYTSIPQEVMLLPSISQEYNPEIRKLKRNPEIEIMYTDKKHAIQLQGTSYAKEGATTVAQRVLGVRCWCKQKKRDGSAQPHTRSLRLKRRASQEVQAEGSLV